MVAGPRLCGAVARFILAAALLASGHRALAAQASALAVRTDSGAQEFWRSSSAVHTWKAAHPTVAAALAWRPTRSAGIEWAELSLQGTGEARFTRVVIVRVDPARARFELVQRTTPAARPGWSIDDAPADATLALNAGQFTGALPWGWLVRDGAEHLAPGRGPLSSAFIVRTDGRIEWIDGDSLVERRRASRRDIAIAFQSYPTLLSGDGAVPSLLHTDSAATGTARASLPRESDINRTHRDARLALGVDRDGRVLIALTRFDGLGGLLDRVPFGLTTPEMAALMGALGARQAMLLDGGISAQMLIRSKGEEQRLSGTRRVPLALVIRDRR